MKKELRKNLVTVLFLCAAVVVMLIMALCLAKDSQKERGESTHDSGYTQTREKPMIIWMHNAPVHKPETLEKALSSGIITHVWVLFLNPQDAPLPMLDKVRQAIKVCKKYNVKVIWARTLWPSYEVQNFRRSDMADPNYYKKFIDTIRTEAQILGADYTTVDTEPYTYFPFMEIRDKPLSQEEFNAIKSAVDKAVAEKGQLDFLAPSCGYFPRHIYDAVKNLGKLKVAEHTYFDIPWKLKYEGWPYDIFGAYINVTKYNEDHPRAPFFTPKEILERQDLWGHKKGLYISANHKGMEKVAEMLSKIRYIEPNYPAEQPNK